MSGVRTLRQLSFAGVAVALLVAACTDDAIVYPNRNLRAAAGEASDGGEAGEAQSTGGAPSAGAPHAGGSSGTKAGSGGMLGDAGSPDVGGAAPTGPVCGNGKIEPPEQCDDGNTISGDGCSAQCQSSCEKCEKNVCPIYANELPGLTNSAYDDCFAAEGKITKGPATGYDRKEVCRELIDCVRAESCGQVRAGSYDVRQCWCDGDWVGVKKPTVQCKTDPDPANPTDPTKFIPGKCASLFQDASENSSLADVEAQFTALNQAEGRAFRLLHSCDSRACAEECLPSFFNAPPVATISGDIGLTANAAGESPLGDLIADSQRAIAAADFAFVQPTFARGPDADNVDLLFAATPNRDADAPGRVLWSEALAVAFGFHSLNETISQSANPQAYAAMSKAKFTGQQIYTALAEQFSPAAGGILFVSGLKYSYTFDADNPTGTVISDLRKASDDSPIDKSATYTIAVNDFLTSSSGPIPTLRSGTDPVVVTANIAEALGDYLTRLPQPVAPPTLNRITRLN